MSAADQPGRAAAAALKLFHNRYALVMVIAVIAMAGWSTLGNMPRIEDPRITNRYPRVLTTLPGAPADRVEALVTDVLEDALKEISEIKKTESVSRSGISILVIELQDDVTSDTNQEIFSRIRDRLSDAATQLPAGASAPFFDDKNSAVAFSLIASVEWRRGGPPELGMLHRMAEDLADRLRDLPGTDIVRLYGSPDEEISVAVDADQLAALGLTAGALAARIAADDPKLPAGALRAYDRDLFIEVAGELNSAARIAAIPLASSASGALLTVGDIAQVEKSWRDPPGSLARTAGARSILVAVRTEENVRLDRWASAAREVVAGFASNGARGIDVNVAFDQSVYTEARLSSLSGNLLAGAGVVMLVVFLGMGWRAALIVGAALPLSASLTIFGLTFFDQQIHQMSIFGMIIAIGLLIDNAIVMTDDIKQRLDAGLAATGAVAAAIRHLFVPLFASTLTTILGFMPVFLLPGAMGDFVGPIAISVVLALSASFLISMTIIPALAGIFIRARDTRRSYRWWNNGLRLARVAPYYRRLLAAAVRRPLLAMALCCVLPLAGFRLAGTLGQEFFPPADRDQFEIEVMLPSDASLARTARLAEQIERDVSTRAGVKQVNWLVGGSYPTIYYNRLMRQDGNSAYAHAMVYTESVAATRRLTRELAKSLPAQFPDAQIIVAPFAQGPPVDSPVGFRITGPDTATLKTLGDEVRRIMHRVPAVIETRASVGGGEPKLSVDADDTATRLAGLTLTDIAGQLQTSLEGNVGGQVLEDLESLPVRIRLAGSERDTQSAIETAKLVSPASGDWIPVNALAAVRLTPEMAGISRYNGERVNSILGYIRSDALAIDVTEAILAEFDKAGFVLPPGYTLTSEGDSAEQKNAFGKLLIYLPILMMLMATTLILSFRSVSLAVLIGTVAFLSVGLGMLALYLGQYARGFNAIIGSAGLIGVAINGTIVVLAAIRDNPRAAAGDGAAIVAATAGATRHIVSTTLTTIGGFAPLLLLSGGDFWPPLAIVIAGGVGFSISLSLVFTPATYTLLARRGSRAATGSGTRLAEQPA